MGSSQPSRDDSVPGDGPGYVPILRVRGGQRLEATVLSERLTGAWQHWVEDHSAPCVEPREECAGCRCRYRRQWRGYLAAQVTGRWPIVLLELTPEACRPYSARLEGRGRGVRGFNVRVSRRDGARRGKVLLEIASAPVGAVDLPPAPDVWQILLAAWSAPRREIETREQRDDEGNWEIITLPGA